MPTYEHEIPARKVRITITTKHLGEVEGWQDRLAAVEKVLLKLAPEPIVGDEHIPVSHAIPMIARDLAMHWEAVANSWAPKKQAVATAKKIQKLALSLVDAGALDGLSLEMVQALNLAARADILASYAKPAKGRSANRGARRLAEAFATHYPWLTGRKPGVNADHDFVMTLGELFRALNFTAKPQHYAKLAVEALASEREAMAARATEVNRQVRGDTQM